MTEFMKLFVAGVFGILTLSFVARENPDRREWGITQSELIAGKDACERTLERNKSCKLVINWEVVDNDQH